MEPLGVLAVATSVIQIVDFASRLLSRSAKIYNSADGQLDEHAALSSATQHLSELCSQLKDNVKTSKRFIDQKILQLSEECQKVAEELGQALEGAQTKTGIGRVESVYHALRLVRKEKKISGIERNLEQIRSQIVLALLISLTLV